MLRKIFGGKTSEEKLDALRGSRSISIKGKAGTHQVWVNNRLLKVPSCAESSREFNWGSRGPQARLLAEAILSCFNPPEVAMDAARWFVEAYVCRWPEGEDFVGEIPKSHVVG